MLRLVGRPCARVAATLRAPKTARSGVAVDPARVHTRADGQRLRADPPMWPARRRVGRRAARTRPTGPPGPAAVRLSGAEPGPPGPARRADRGAVVRGGTAAHR